MIHELAGDLQLSGAQAIAHGVAPNDHFDTGLAMSLRQDWPAMYKDFRHFCHTSNPKPGEVWIWSGAGGHRIACLFTQEPAAHEKAHPGRATLHNVNVCLRELAHAVAREGITSLALPRLATGVGGLSWDDVKPLIVSHLGSLKIPVYLYSTFRKGVKADEPAH